MLAVPQTIAQNESGTDEQLLFYQVYLKATPALAAFRKTIGKANYDLNTLRAGLGVLRNLIAAPQVRFAVVWEPKDLVHDADEAERFAIKSLLVYAVDALDRYMIGLGHIPSVLRDSVLRSTMRGEFQSTPSSNPATSGNVQALSASLAAKPEEFETLLKDFREKHLPRSRRPGMRARFDKLMTCCGSVPAHHKSAVHILVSWRNRYVHGASNDGVSPSVAAAWRQALPDLRRSNPRADGGGLIARFEAGESPTPDDVITLIALLHRTVTTADADLVHTADAEAYALATFAKTFWDLPEPIDFAKSVWGRTEASRANKFLAMTIPGGFHRVARSKIPAAANAVADDLWWRLARLDRSTFLASMRSLR